MYYFYVIYNSINELWYVNLCNFCMLLFTLVDMSSFYQQSLFVFDS